MLLFVCCETFKANLVKLETSKQALSVQSLRLPHKLIQAYVCLIVGLKFPSLWGQP